MLRVYLSGHVVVEAPDARLEPTDFPGQQGREVFAYFVTRQGIPVAHAELASAIWGDAPPASADTAIRSNVSKLRKQFARVGLDGASTLRSAKGSYELWLPPDTWIDHPIAFNSVHEAEAALEAEDHRAAFAPSAIARHICQRPFLPGNDAEWVEVRRQKLQRTLVRALECRARVYLWNKEYPLAIEAAREATTLEPFRESAHRFLMRAHAAAGNAAEALRVYEECRRFIADELGVPPSVETRQTHAAILKAL